MITAMTAKGDGHFKDVGSDGPAAFSSNSFE